MKTLIFINNYVLRNWTVVALAVISFYLPTVARFSLLGTCLALNSFMITRTVVLDLKPETFFREFMGWFILLSLYFLDWEVAVRDNPALKDLNLVMGLFLLLPMVIGFSVFKFLFEKAFIKINLKSNDHGETISSEKNIDQTLKLIE